MKLAYVDTSYLVAIAFGEGRPRDLAAELARHDRLFSSNLLEAELRSAMAREQVREDCSPFLEGITWVFPQQPLTSELRQVLSVGYLRGADLWHVACGPFLKSRLRVMSFLTLDERQSEVAARLGFRASP